MLTLAPDACCEVCLEPYSETVLPYSMPCGLYPYTSRQDAYSHADLRMTGHILCAKCCNGVIDSNQIVSLCPFCRSPYARDGVRVVRADIMERRSEGRKPSFNMVPIEPMPRPMAQLPEPQKHPATCDDCRQMLVGDRFVSGEGYHMRPDLDVTQKCIHCPDFDMCSQCFPYVPSRRSSFTNLLIPTLATSPFVTRNMDLYAYETQKTTSFVLSLLIPRHAELNLVY